MCVIMCVYMYMYVYVCIGMCVFLSIVFVYLFDSGSAVFSFFSKFVKMGTTHELCNFCLHFFVTFVMGIHKKS